MNSALYLIPLLLAVSIPTAFAQTAPEESSISVMSILPDGTILDENGDEIVYVKTWQLSQTDDIIQVQLEKGKMIFQKDSGAVTVFDENEIVIKSDSYVVRGAEINTDLWSNLSVNDSPVTFTIDESEYDVIITFTRENDEGKFDVETIVSNENSKTTAKFTNYIYENYKFAFTETLDFPDDLIKLNSQDIDLTLYSGQSFPREVLEENIDLILQAKEIYFNAGLGFEHLWQVNISENNKVSLDWANVGERLTGIGETVELDPSLTFTLNSGSGNSNTQFNRPYGVTADSNGNIWVADTYNHRVQKFDSSGNYLLTIGTTGSYGSTNAKLKYPYGVTVDRHDDLYISDSSNNRIQKFSPSGTYLQTFSNSALNSPKGTDIDSGLNLYVASNGTHKVMKFNSSGSLLYAVGSYGTGNNNFRYPHDIAYAGSSLYVVDQYNGKVKKISSSTGAFISNFVTGLSYPEGVDRDITTGYIHVSNTNSSQVKVYNTSGTLQQTYYGFSYPSQVDLDSIGSMYVANRNQHNVKVYLNITAPSAPTNLTTSQSVANQITLNWTAPSSGSAPTSYEVYLNGSLIDTIGNVTTYTDNITGAEIGASLTYMVKAINAAGSATSNNSIIASWDVPDAPTGFQAVTGSPITMSWVTPLSDDTVTNFKIYRDGTLIDTVGVVNSYTDNTTVSGNSYSYTASAVSAVGEGSQSSSSTATAGISWNSPGSVSVTIPDANNFPYGIDVSWSASTQGSGTGVLTGYELWRTNGTNTVLVTTLTGLTYSDTVTLANTNFEYFVKSTSTHGTSGNSPNSNTVTTPGVPSAINDLAGSVISDVQINLSWSAPNDGGSNIDLYKIFKDGVQVDTTTSTTYSLTGLTSNTAYAITVFSNNSIGDSLASNSITKTTYQAVSGSITITKTTVGATSKLEFTSTSTGTPTPNFNSFTLNEGGIVLASGISTPYYLALNDADPHTYTITSYDGTHWNTPTISGTVTETSAYPPTWNNNVSYNYTRAGGVMDLTVNKDSQVLWDATCNYRTTAEVLDDQVGLTSTHTGVWNISESQNISDTDTVYVSCTDDGTTLFSFTSFGPNRLGGGIAQLNDTFDGMIGTPVALIFILLVAGLFTGRSAPTGILLVLALVGVLGFIGMVSIEEAVWGFLLLAGVLGIFLGKRFL